jgi:hypothetical protein
MREFSLDPTGADWKGLDKVLSEIANMSPGVRLDHTDHHYEGEREAWRGDPDKKIMTVERWLATVQKDIKNAPDARWRSLITGPYYYWGYDELGRVQVATEHQKKIVPMFIEPWAGEPDA